MAKKITFTKKEHEAVSQASKAGYESLVTLKKKMDAAAANVEDTSLKYQAALVSVASCKRVTFDSKPSLSTMSKVNNILKSEEITLEDLQIAVKQAEKSWRGNIYFPSLVFSCKKLIADFLNSAGSTAVVTKKPGFYTDEEPS